MINKMQNSIPKIIHFVWLNKAEMPDSIQQNIEAWKTILPDYEFMLWSEKNFDALECRWVKEAIDKKKYNLAVDAVRAYALYEHGGIYLDVNTIVHKSFDHLLDNDAFVAYERVKGAWVSGRVMGSVKNHGFMRYLYSYYNRHLRFASDSVTITEIAKKYYSKFKPDGREQLLIGEDKLSLKILTSDYFYPIDFFTKKENKTDNTVSSFVRHPSLERYTKKELRSLKLAKGARKIFGRKLFGLLEKYFASRQRGLLRRLLRRRPLTESEHILGVVQDDIIKVKNVYKSYEELDALDGVSFRVKRGALCMLLGASGSGKSTTINILSTLTQKGSGLVEIDGLDYNKEANIIRNRIGIAFQKSVLDEKLTVNDNLRSRASLYYMTIAERREAVEGVSRLMHIENVLKKRYDKLTSFEKRRVDIARALVHEPKILLLDEPTLGLDSNSRDRLWQIVASLVKLRRLTVVCSTHSIDEASRADSIVIFDNGKVAVQGSPDELKSTYTADLVRLVSPQSLEIEDFLTKLKKSFSYKNNAYQVEFGSPKEALEFLKENPQFTDFEIFKGDLEDVFYKVTGKMLEGGL